MKKALLLAAAGFALAAKLAGAESPLPITDYDAGNGRNPNGCRIVVYFRDEGGMVVACPNGDILSKGPEPWAVFEPWEGCFEALYAPGMTEMVWLRHTDLQDCYGAI